MILSVFFYFQTIPKLGTYSESLNIIVGSASFRQSHSGIIALVVKRCAVPCFPGYFVKYTTGSMASSSGKCQECPDDYYQDRFGMSTCYSCPGVTEELDPNVSFSKSFCLGEIHIILGGP